MIKKHKTIQRVINAFKAKPKTKKASSNKQETSFGGKDLLEPIELSMTRELPIPELREFD